MIGTRINNLEVIEQIGVEGNFGIVCKVQDHDANDKKAIKIFRNDRGRLEEKRFIKENDILHKLKPHNNIILPLSKVLTFNGYIYYLLELADCNLGKYIDSKHNLQLQTQLDIFIQVCEGLKHAHSKEIVHRDLHRKNILIKISNGIEIVKLTDFGKARDFAEIPITTSYAPWGAMEITAPEVIAQVTNKNSSFKEQTLADIFSLGIILHIIFNPLSSLYTARIIELFGLANTNGIYSKGTTSSKRKEFYNNCISYFKLYNLNNLLQVTISGDDKINQKINELIFSMTAPDFTKRISDLGSILDKSKGIKTEINNA
ncbi:MAG: protein kinase [Candidatus Omnitrophota bacterium]|nr:protein kinase [Candidatus Omnitrophota bacterium]